MEVHRRNFCPRYLNMVLLSCLFACSLISITSHGDWHDLLACRVLQLMRWLLPQDFMQRFTLVVMLSLLHARACHAQPSRQAQPAGVPEAVPRAAGQGAHSIVPMMTHRHK